ncbi:MAG: DUF1616 domain-containing protein [Candidatus Hodarchaeota archaeon]
MPSNADPTTRKATGGGIMRRHTQTVLTILMFAIVFTTGTLLVSVWFLPPVEYTSTIALLNENMQAGPYPTNVTQYSNVTVNVDIYNYMGVAQYYYVRTKLANATTMATASTPSSAPILLEHQRILSHGSRWVIPIELNMTQVGNNFRLTFELWRYDPATDAIVWVRNQRGNGLWVHLPMNVTG